MSKSDHMLSILWTLSQGRRVTAAELSERLEISIRSVYRYIDSLCASGVPVLAEAGPGGGYSLPEHFTAAPLFFADDELRALVQSAAFARAGGYPYTEALDRAVAKLKHYTNDDQLQLIQRHETGFGVIPSPSVPAAELLAGLEHAAAHGQTLTIRYAGQGRPQQDRNIDPYGLVYWKGSWYLVGFCHLRGEIRSFRADRIAGSAPTGGTFVRPAGFVARDALLRGLLPDPGAAPRLVPVIIQADAAVLNELCNHWLFGHTLSGRSDTEARFLLDEEALLGYAPYFLLPYGRALRIKEPEMLRGRLAAIAAGLASHYGGE